MRLTAEDERHLRDLISDDLGYISTFFEIPNKQQIRVPLIPFPAQKMVLDTASRFRRLLVVKPGQTGITTICTAKFLKKTITTPDTTSVIMSHNEFLTSRLLHRAQVMYDSCPPRFKPRQDRKSAYEKRFPEINSIMYISTAQADVAGRGEPIHNLLLSEAAFYSPDAKERIIIPALQRVPITGEVIMESTPNGEDRIFYKEVEQCLDGTGTFHLLVIYWWDEPGNILPSGEYLSELNIPKSEWGDFKYTEEEEQLVSKHDLHINQIRFRRWKIREAGKLFWQEHLEDLNTCFLISGQPYYDEWRTLELSKQCYEAKHGYEGAMVWVEPEKGIDYFIGIDPGQGRTSQSVATVWKLVDFKPVHVATLAGMYESHIFYPMCMRLGQYYNIGMLIPEANAHGIAFVDGVRGYPRLYYRKDIIRGVRTSAIGWLTTSSTKPFMMQELQRQLMVLDTYDAELVRQIRAMKDVGNGRAVTTTLDDYHDAACLAMMGMVGYNKEPERALAGVSGWKW